MRRIAALFASLCVLATPAVSNAEKLPLDEGLRATLSPGITKMRVGQSLVFTMSITDDDAISADATLEVEGGEGNGVFSDGACSSPLQRSPLEGRVSGRAKFSKPGRYVIRGVVTTIACHGQVTGMGSERVVVSRTVTVTR